MRAGRYYIGVYGFCCASSTLTLTAVHDYGTTKISLSASLLVCNWLVDGRGGWMVGWRDVVEVPPPGNVYASESAAVSTAQMVWIGVLAVLFAQAVLMML